MCNHHLHKGAMHRRWVPVETLEIMSTCYRKKALDGHAIIVKYTIIVLSNNLNKQGHKYIMTQLNYSMHDVQIHGRVFLRLRDCLSLHSKIINWFVFFNPIVYLHSSNMRRWWDQLCPLLIPKHEAHACRLHEPDPFALR